MMTQRSRYDAVVVGSGPNGLAAAITVAQAGHSVLVLEAKETIGGGTRSGELTLPGFVHDVCSAAHPLGASSPFFRQLPLTEYGLEWVFPPLPVAHPLPDGRAAALEPSVETTGAGLGCDADAYRRLMGPLVADWERLLPTLLAPLQVPRHPLALARFGLRAVRSAVGLARDTFQGEKAQALFAGLAAHSMLPLEAPLSAAFGLVLGMSAHAVGWPVARGGSQKIADALAAYLCALGGDIVTNQPVRTLADVPPARAVFFDLTPRQVLAIAGERLPPGYRQRLAGYRYGPGVCKIDWALDGPIPWQATMCRQAGTVHVGGTLAEIAASERDVWAKRHAEWPYILLVQPSLFDPSRAPQGKHTAWAYCHVPNGSTLDMTEKIERQIERFAPGFRDLVLARHTRSAAAMEQYNANYIGGDINGGVQDWRQHYTRPMLRRVPYALPVPGLYLCSSSTPPGGGVHGMCGYFAARAALRNI